MKMDLFSRFKPASRQFYVELIAAKTFFANKAKAFTQRREDAKAMLRKSLRILCGSASLRALLFFCCISSMFGGGK
ncbi:MAG: hypothetical protein ACREOI_34825 [bacterium]